jgi:hypothetical protein
MWPETRKPSLTADPETHTFFRTLPGESMMKAIFLRFSQDEFLPDGAWNGENP